MQFILCTRHEEFEILVYTWYKNSISHIHHLSIRAKHVGVFRTEPIDGIHYVLHACMPGVQRVIFRPSVQLVIFWYLLSMVASIIVLWGGQSAMSSQVFQKPAKISTGQAKYMTNQKRYTTVISEYILL